MRDDLKDIALESVNSTNRWAKEHIAELADGTVVTAKIQTNGRGRLNRNWVDLGVGNLFLSFVLKPDMKFSGPRNFRDKAEGMSESFEWHIRQRSSGSACVRNELQSNSCFAEQDEQAAKICFNDNFANITQYLSVVLARTLENYGVKPQIKWPNDVLINGKKIAGILAETTMSQNSFNGLVLGIGVNLNAHREDFNKIDKPATALNLETGEKTDLEKFKQELCEEFFNNYDEFLEKGFSFIMDEYVKRACFIDKELTVVQVGTQIKGLAKGVTERGELILENNNKELILNIGDIL